MPDTFHGDLGEEWPFLSISHKPQTTWKIETESQRGMLSFRHHPLLLSSLPLLPESTGRWSTFGCTQNVMVKSSLCSVKQLPSPAYKARLPPPPQTGRQMELRVSEASGFNLYSWHLGNTRSKPKLGITMAYSHFHPNMHQLPDKHLPLLLLRQPSHHRTWLSSCSGKSWVLFTILG